MTYNARLNALLRASVTVNYYCNGPPTWIVSRGKPWQRLSQTNEEAETQRDAEVRKLRWHERYSNMPDAGRLAAVLENCRPLNRCFSGACPICLRAVQRWYVDQGASVARHIARDGEQLVALSMVPDFGQALPGALNRFDWARFVSASRHALLAAGIRNFYLGVDASLDEDEGDPSSRFFQVHLWGLVGSRNGAWRDTLKVLCTAKNRVNKPVEDSPPRDCDAVVAYALKSKFNRREWFLDESRPNRNPFLNTRNRPLNDPPWVELKCLLHRVGPEARILIGGVNRAVTVRKVDAAGHPAINVAPHAVASKDLALDHVSRPRCMGSFGF
jgi:hypothetical protein